MASKRDNPFFDAVCNAASKDKNEITQAIMSTIRRRGITLVVFHDVNGNPIVFDKEGSHGDLKKSLRQNPDGTFTAEKSSGETVYVGEAAASFLSCLGLVTSEQAQVLRREAQRA